MTNFNMVLPYTNYNIAGGYSSASAAASSSGSYASSSASSCGGGVQNFFGGFNQLNNVVGGQQGQNPFMGMMQMMMQFMMMMMQMMMQMFGMGQQQNQYGQPQNALQNPQGQFPFSSPSQMAGLYGGPANASAAAGPGGASAAASAGGASAAAAAGGSNNALLSKVDPKELEAVKGQDLGALDKNGNPVYLIAKGKKDGKYHIYKQLKEGNAKKYKCVSKVKQGNNYLYVKNPEKNKEAAAAAAANGGSSASASASSMSFSYNPWTGDMTWNYSTAAAAAYSNNPGIMENQSDYTTGSPLILDTNKDGKVSAQQGMGVDVNGDGKADGAATGGDKMLAMGDIDGDGQITGKEVFGNETVDPFTGQKLNAANGFDALAQVAKSAEKHTGIKCMDENGQVDLQKLKQALEQSGKGSLGMISGNNTTTLEGLGDAAKINTSNYTNQQQTGAVQHNQLGSYTDANGQTHRVDDVWFKLA